MRVRESITSMDIWLTKQARISHLLMSFPQPETYSCHVRSYSRSHGRMLIELMRPQQEMYQPSYMFLHSVWYFAGPFRWRGIDFQVQIPGIDFMRYQLGWKTMAPDVAADFVSHHVLLVHDRPNGGIHILAGDCLLITEQEAEWF